MALITHKDLDSQSVLGIWKVEESDHFFESGLHLFEEEQEELAILKGRKRSEWLSSRYLLHQLSNVTDRYPCLKDTFGKPYLKGFDKFISLSHSGDYAAALISDRSCGIDVQILVPKISRIVSKFIREDEFAFIPDTSNDILYYHAIWGAKESMYKAYGKKGLDFKKEMQISEFEILEDNFSFQGNISREQFRAEFKIYCQIINSLILVYAIQE